METFFVYIIKSNALIVVFFLAYCFLVEKETFFNSNRWFLLGGLFTSIVTPLFFIKKIVFIESPKMAINSMHLTTSTTEIIAKESFDWFPILAVGYTIVGSVLFLKIISNLISLFKLLNKKQIIKNDNFNLVDVNENINPFSFFKYIVFNSRFYSNEELESILLHEKVHSREKHSVDVLIAKLFCTIFWFNPFVWLYKKAILQNLEYIADKKAIQNIENKKAYQMTLLKVVTDQNCLSITNSFYQSLIKKRIVMLNKNQSKKWSTWKYAVVIPVLVAFVLFFQIKVVAQEKETKNSLENNNIEVSTVIVTKNSTNQELSADEKRIKKYAAIDLKFSGIKRNKKGEITGIIASFNDNNGSKGQHKIEGDEPISIFKFSAKKFKNGEKEIGFFDAVHEDDVVTEDLEMPEIPEIPEIPEVTAALTEMNEELPSLPTPPVAPSMKKMPTPPTPPNFPKLPNIKAPKDPNDKKAWRKYEAEMDHFAKGWENGSEMKKFEAEMKAFEKKMEAYQPDMTSFDKEMQKFEAKMEKYNNEMESYHEKIREANENKQEALREEMETKREHFIDKRNAEREAMFAKREAINAKREAIRAKREAENAKINDAQ